MRKQLLIIFLLITVSDFYSQGNGIATFCFLPTGECWEVEQVRRYGLDWENACCEHFHLINELPMYTCTDDCGNPDPPNALQLPSNFEGATPHFTIGNRNVWIVEDMQLSLDTYNNQSLEYQDINAMPDWNWLDSCDSVSHVGIVIDTNTHAIVERVNYSSSIKLIDDPVKRKTPNAEIEAYKELHRSIMAEQSEQRRAHWEKNKHLYQIQLFPNPVNTGEFVFFETLINVKSVTLYDNSGRQFDVELKKADENKFYFSLERLEGYEGLLFVNVRSVTGEIYKVKLKVLK
ncbi:MAG: hypothetical protein CMO34_07050 [Verrucomicrobia bacterium]|nr:hypothetical protein [Verrucomicrobiota bacterium]